MNKVRYGLRAGMLVLAIVIAGMVVIRSRMERPAPVSSSINATYDLGSVRAFSFTDQNGATITRESLKGKVWIADFVFTRCMGPCPLLTQRMAGLQKEFSNVSDLKFISFSVDPDFDTPEVLKAYAEGYKADGRQWHFLTGKRDEIYTLIRESFKLAVAPEGQNESGGMDILHSLHFVLVDRDGKILGYFNSAEEGALDRLRGELRETLDPELARD